MAQCKFCSRKGFFFSVNDDGLCKNCAPAVGQQIMQSVRVIEESRSIIKNSKNTSTRISRCDTILSILERLSELESKGIPTLNPKPTELHRMFTIDRDELIFSGTKDDVEKLFNKAELATTIKSSLTNANNALLKVIEAKKEINNPEILNDLEIKIKTYTHKIQLQSFLDEADKAVFKGNIKKAIDQYKEALYFLKTDGIDDHSQQNEMGEIQSKIDALQNSLTKQ